MTGCDTVAAHQNPLKKVTQTSTSSIVNDDLETNDEKKLELEEKELKLEKERLEILTEQAIKMIYLPFTKSFDNCLAIDT
ncbi:hypothetical protein RhiirA4_471337 [Rhizophagus irregularis]|uniref:Uncharacterized protein n=1 Tax=Rhizophagus irregularis TaxID=588596 RepID=A0A2I1H2X8_9GLOM|nr:hypothetical protein RhiirA4_471337 [Rhizophagus irregularis]